MRIVIQKVSEAAVTINNKITSKIAHGLIILLGIEAADNETDIAYLWGVLKIHFFQKTKIINQDARHKFL